MVRNLQSKHISGGIFLISLGVLMITNWWWPGIMLAIGLAAGAELAFNGKYIPALLTFGVFTAIPVSISIVPWALVAPLILISLGLVALAKSLLGQSQTLS